VSLELTETVSEPNDSVKSDPVGEHGDAVLVGFGAVRMDGDGCGSVECVAPEEILFAFTQGAVRAASVDGRRPAIVARWTPKLSFAPATVYLRTRAGIYRSYLRTLVEFKSRVSAARFDVVSQSVIANLSNVDAISLGRQRPRSISYDVEESELAWPLEIVIVGREFLKRIRSRFGIPTRPRSDPNSPDA
jgi:hypothetical protein